MVANLQSHQSCRCCARAPCWRCLVAAWWRCRQRLLTSLCLMPRALAGVIRLGVVAGRLQPKPLFLPPERDQGLTDESLEIALIAAIGPLITFAIRYTLFAWVTGCAQPAVTPRR